MEVLLIVLGCDWVEVEVLVCKYLDKVGIGDKCDVYLV